MLLRTRYVFVLTCVLLGLLFTACSGQNTGNLLNSDRIRQKFGSYGVEILFADPQQRISSLYSQSGNDKITRTLAIVQYPQLMSDAIRTEHLDIVAGGSIGEVFRSAGWEVEKHTIFVGEVTLDADQSRVASLMNIALPDRLATHSYSFVVIYEQTQIDYATITEIHHPNYMTLDALRAIYGEMLFDDSGKETLADFIELPDDF